MIVILLEVINNLIMRYSYNLQIVNILPEAKT